MPRCRGAVAFGDLARAVLAAGPPAGLLPGPVLQCQVVGASQWPSAPQPWAPCSALAVTGAVLRKWSCFGVLAFSGKKAVVRHVEPSLSLQQLLRLGLSGTSHVGGAVTPVLLHRIGSWGVSRLVGRASPHGLPQPTPLLPCCEGATRLLATLHSFWDTVGAGVCTAVPTGRLGSLSNSATRWGLRPAKHPCSWDTAVPGLGGGINAVQLAGVGGGEGAGGGGGAAGPGLLSCFVSLG